MQLLERDAALSALGEWTDDARAARARIVLVSGEAGAGKTTLVRALGARLPDAVQVQGLCDGMFTPTPLGPLLEIAEQLGGPVLDLCRANVEPRVLYAAFTAQLVRAARLTVVVIEDVHWADEATLDMLRYLGRRLGSARVLLVLTFRNDAMAATHPLRLLLGDFAGLSVTRRVDVGPLSPAAVGELTMASGLAGDEVYRLTGGNPFYVTAVLQAGRDRVPLSARDAVLARAADLGDAARAALHSAALVGTALDPRLLGRLADADEVDLDSLLLTGLLAADGTGLRFRHEIARQAVEQSIPVHRRRSLHARILATFEALDSTDDALLAFHAEQAGDPGAIARHAPRAAERAAHLASRRESIAQYERALRVGYADEATRARWYEGLARQSWLIDRWQACLAAETNALALWRVLGDRLREGDAMQRLAHVYWNLGRGAESLAVAEAAVVRLEPLGATIELARALATVAAKYMTHHRSIECIAVARRAQEMAVRFDAFDVQSSALNSEGCSAACLGDDWLGPLLASLELAREHDLPDEVARAYSNTWGNAVDQRRFAEFADLYRAGIAYCDEHELDAHRRFLQAGQLDALFHSGRWAESLELCNDLRRAGDRSLVNTISALTRCGSIAARTEDSGAHLLLDEAWRRAADVEEAQYVIPVLVARAEACWLAGDVDAAHDDAKREDAAVAATADAWLRGEVAVWCHRIGVPLADPSGLAEPYALETSGAWQRAAAWWTAHECPYDAAFAQLGSDDESGIRAALDAFVALGATATARLARRRLRVLGVRSIPVGPRRATQAHPSGLTQRQQDVLPLLAAGSTNAEIAAELFLSVKTVDHHVSAILAQLGVTTRHAAVRKAAQLGLVRPSYYGKHG